MANAATQGRRRSAPSMQQRKRASAAYRQRLQQVGPIGAATYSRLSRGSIRSIISASGAAWQRGGAVAILFDIVSVRTFWRILLFVHFLLAVALLAAVTLQAAAIMIPVRQAAGTFIQRLRPGPAASYAAPAGL